MPISWDTARKRWRFYFDRVIEGRRYRYRKRLPAGWSQAQAEEYERKETAKLYRIASGVEQSEPLIEQAVAVYVAKRVPVLRNGKKCAQELANLLPYYKGRLISELPDVADRYSTENPDLAPATIRNRLSYLRGAVRYAWKRRAIKNAPPPMLMPEVRNQRHLYLKDADQTRFLELIDDDEARALFTLSYYVGARWRAEILPRQPADVQKSEDGKLWLQCGITKNNRPVMKFIHPDAHWTLRYLPFQYGDSHYYRIFRKARADFGNTDLVPHDQRHSLASHLLSNGFTLDDVRGVLGHQSVQAAARYSHLYPSRQAEVLARGLGKKLPPPKGRRKK